MELNRNFSLFLPDFKSDQITSQGYKNEIHSVTTADRYILTLQRIPSARRSLRPVILNHGMFASAYWFVMASRVIPKANSLGNNLKTKCPTKLPYVNFNTSEAYKLADSGYDVWLTNCRPTTFARHKDIPRSSPRYWQFSFHEIGKYDIPAIIDYVLMTTNHTFVHFVGHSQGATTVIAMLSMFPQYNKKIKTLHLMAPAVYFGYPGPIYETIAAFEEPLEVNSLFPSFGN